MQFYIIRISLLHFIKYKHKFCNTNSSFIYNTEVIQQFLRSFFKWHYTRNQLCILQIAIQIAITERVKFLKQKRKLALITSMCFSFMYTKF